MNKIVSIILAAGYGTRINDLTGGSPKQLLPVAGETLITRLLRQLTESGVREHFLSRHTHSNTMVDYIVNLGGIFGNVQFLESQPTKGANLFELLSMVSSKNNEPFGTIIAMGDNVFGDGEVRAFLDFAKFQSQIDMIFATSDSEDGASGKVFAKKTGFSRDRQPNSVEYCGMAYLNWNTINRVLKHPDLYRSNSITGMYNNLMEHGAQFKLHSIEVWYDINDMETYQRCLQNI